MSTVTVAARHFGFGQRNRLMQHRVEIGALHLQAQGPHELQHLDDDGVGELGFADDVGEQRLRVRGVRHLAPQQAGHDLDAGKRILELVGDAGRHLAERRQPIAQPLALFKLFDLREVLEEHHRADYAPVVVFDPGQRVANHAAQVLQPDFGAVRQMAQLEGAGEDADDVEAALQDIGERTADVAWRPHEAEHPIRLVVHQRQHPVAPERDDAVAHAANQVSEEPIIGRRPGGSACDSARAAGGPRRSWPTPR